MSQESSRDFIVTGGSNNQLPANQGRASAEIEIHPIRISHFIYTDAYGGTAEKRAKFLLDILTQCRGVAPAGFCIGVKINSADHDTADFEDTICLIGLLVEGGIDFLEVSGGSAADPKMVYGNENKHPEQKTLRSAAREAFFLEFAAETRKRFPKLILMLTGGFRSRAGAEAAIRDSVCDLVGIARPAAVNPKLPLLLIDESVPDMEAKFPLNKVQTPRLAKILNIKVLGAGAESVSGPAYMVFLNRLDRFLAHDNI
ncbi:uncharacterized protein Aud_000015 [Aspergillus udagawae]|uniref:NADH:flavin oxidoreductase/NADH oxidase N-terminal domain-containing protein n=1 Tax=Aspergillus udagawae TaxID=91492 RepID=A0A8E0QJH8_9EURO|nr:uncharacterized protein Aud_000015 [Aspergillus udagawae]GIC84201.1 hypothetical protein Aud_000015 [Aspergillus udagawae]